MSTRISEERCERLGESCGYSVRLESKRSPATRILFCTTGVLLRRLQCDPDLAAVSHVFVDEVHERDLNTDFVLIILKDLLLRRKSLKLVLMSATLNAETFSDYFGGVPTISIPGRAHPVTEYRLEDVLEFTGYVLPPGHDSEEKNPELSLSEVKKRFPKCGTDAIKTLHMLDESIINYDLVTALVSYIHCNCDDGAILIFMPGLMPSKYPITLVIS